jgi:hypothetical protein
MTAQQRKTVFVDNPKVKTSNQRTFPDYASPNLAAPIAKGKVPITKNPSVRPMREPKKKKLK